MPSPAVVPAKAGTHKPCPLVPLRRMGPGSAAGTTKSLVPVGADFEPKTMPIRLDTRAPDFAERFRAFLATKREGAADVEAAVRAIIADVVPRGDRALVELTQKFDRVDLDRIGLKVTAEEIEAAHAACDRRALDALPLARARIDGPHRPPPSTELR